MYQFEMFTDRKRKLILEHEEEIWNLKSSSKYFNDFLQIGLLDFFYFTCSNAYHFEEEDFLFSILQKVSSIHEFWEVFVRQVHLSLIDFYEILFTSINCFVSLPIDEKLRILAICYTNQNSHLLNLFSYYLEDIWTYVAPAKHWNLFLQYLFYMEKDMNRKILFDVANQIKESIQCYPPNISESIFLNLQIQHKIPFYNLETKSIKEGYFLNVCYEEVGALYQNLNKTLVLMPDDSTEKKLYQEN